MPPTGGPSKDPRKMDDSTKDKVVELYQAGVKTQDITEQTGVPRPSIYWVLNERGVRPSRNKRDPDGIDVAQVLEQLAAAERQVGALKERLARQEALNDALLERLSPVAQNGHDSTLP